MKFKQALNNIPEKKKLESFYLYHCLIGEIYSRLNNSVQALQSFETAIQLTQSETEKKMMKNKILTLLN
jgi:predicted RNA polymerase sigma factor